MPEHAKGTLLHHEPLPTEFWPAHAAQAHRMLYAGLGYHGGPRDVTGIALVPDTPYPPTGCRSLGTRTARPGSATPRRRR